MSAGPISQERAGHGVPRLPALPKVGALVVPDEFPAGFPRWRIEEMPPAAGHSDVLLLTTTDTASPVRQIRRRISQVRVVAEGGVR